jgi:4-amino-4-deoxy-L-arabinose transferase-like glycosyltransferase
VGAVVAALVTLPGLGVGTLWDNSETAYGEVAREILVSHDWVVMHLNGLPWFVQPPLYFWIAAICAKIFGVGSFSLRLPAALATIAMGGVTGYAVARQAGTRAGIFASLVLSTCFMQAVVGRLAIMDALLDLAVAFTIFWWFRALQNGRDRYVVFGWIAAACGFLVKGPVAPVAALLVIVPYALWSRREEPTFLPSLRAWLVSVLAFCAIVVPWFAAFGARSGAGSVLLLLGHYTFGRYTGVIENQSGPLWYYLPVIIIGFFPWIAFLPVAIAWGIRRLRLSDASPEIARLIRLAFVWTVLPLVFFSFAKTKLPNYVALEFPALALLVGLYLDAVAAGARRLAAIVSVATVPIFIGVVAFAIALFTRDNRLAGAAASLRPDMIVTGAAIFFGSLVTLVLLWRRTWTEYAPYGLGVATIVVMATIAIFAEPHAEAFKPVPSLAAVIQQQRIPGDVVAIQSIPGSNALLFYTQPRVYVLAAPDVNRSNDGILARTVICSAPRAFVIAPTIRPAYDPTYGRTRRAIASNGRATLFLYSGPHCT